MPQFPTRSHPIYTLMQPVIYFDHPNDENKRAEVLDALEGIRLGQTFLQNPSSVVFDKKQRALIVNAPPPQQFFEASLDNTDKYIGDVGDILLTVLTLAEHAPRLASVNNAVALRMRRRAQLGHPTLSREHIFRKWSQFKPISHFLAALLMGTNSFFETPLLKNVWKEVPKKGNHFDLEAFEAANSNVTPWAIVLMVFGMLDWASLAEQLRRRAEKTFAHGQKIPLLTSEETWFFGPEIPLSQPEFCLAPLPKDEIGFLIT